MVPGFKQDVNFTLQDEGERERSLFKSSESDHFILDACETVSDAVVQNQLVCNEFIASCWKRQNQSQR